MYKTILLRSTLFYILINIFIRLMGKREVGELSIIDLIVSMFISNVAAISIENYDKSIWMSLIPIFVLVILQVIFSLLAIKSSKIRKIVDGTPSVIIKNGIVNFKEMLRQRYNLDDLLTQLREKSVKSIDDVDYAILETSGKLSVFKKDENHDYPLAVILDGTIDMNTLKELGKTKEHLLYDLSKYNIKVEDVFYAFYKNKSLYIIDKNKL